MTYIEMLAGRGMKIGDQVVCDYRVPFANQWWIHPFWVGVIEDVSRDKAEWNGHNSEEYYCVLLKTVKVRYLPGSHTSGHVQHDSLGNLRQLCFGDVAESPSFASEWSDYDALRAFSARCGMMDRFPHRLQIVERAA